MQLIQRLRTEGGLGTYYSSQEKMSGTERVAAETLDQTQRTAAGRTTSQYHAMIAADAAALKSYATPDGVELATIPSR